MICFTINSSCNIDETNVDVFQTRHDTIRDLLQLQLLPDLNSFNSCKRCTNK